MLSNGINSIINTLKHSLKVTKKYVHIQRLKFTIFTLALLTLLSCGNSTKSEVTKVVDTFFNNKNNNFREIDSNLISKDLNSLIQKAKAKEVTESLKVKNSAYPTDKPNIIEGNIFTSLYEGQNSFKILEINIAKNKASVLVEFSNTNYKETWKDEILLVKEDKWKIDNVNYKKNTSSESTKQILDRFIKM